MRYWSLLLLLVIALSCSQKKNPLPGETSFQKKMNSDFKDASKSPLTEKDLKAFKGLDFFPFDSIYVVTGKLQRTPNSEWFKMKTNTERLSLERVYGVLSFELKGKPYRLKVYQGQENMQQEGFEDYLFLPFLDDTNGSATYGGGRYIDLRIPEDSVLTLDFNTAYSPYCAYNEKFSCPIVPRENYLDLEVRAGVKSFKN